MAIRRTITQENFDSVLEPARPGQPAKLTIQLSVALVPLDPSVWWLPDGTKQSPWFLADSKAQIKTGLVQDYNQNLVQCRRWYRAEWEAYKLRFKHAAETGCNNQLILLPTPSSDPADALDDQDYLQFVGNPKVQAHAQGAIEITVLPHTARGHALIEVAHLDTPGSSFRVWMHRITDESVQFQRHTDKDWPGWSTGQITAAHEVGHWLRSLEAGHFEHIDWEYSRTLPAALRGRKQYGRTLGRESALMGVGSVVTEHEARPWLTRIRRQTTMKTGWSMMHRINFEKVSWQISDRQKRLTGGNP